jgi:hypothetical protein
VNRCFSVEPKAFSFEPKVNTFQNPLKIMYNTIMSNHVRIYASCVQNMNFDLFCRKKYFSVKLKTNPFDFKVKLDIF